MRTDDFDSSNQLKAHPRPISDDDLGVLKSGPAGHLWSENHSENPLVNPSRAKNTGRLTVILLLFLASGIPQKNVSSIPVKLYKSRGGSHFERSRSASIKLNWM